MLKWQDKNVVRFPRECTRIYGDIPEPCIYINMEWILHLFHSGLGTKSLQLPCITFDTETKRKAIGGTSPIEQISQATYKVEDEETLKRLYGLK